MPVGCDCSTEEIDDDGQNSHNALGWRRACRWLVAVGQCFGHPGRLVGPRVLRRSACRMLCDLVQHVRSGFVVRPLRLPHASRAVVCLVQHLRHVQHLQYVQYVPHLQHVRFVQQVQHLRLGRNHGSKRPDGQHPAGGRRGARSQLHRQPVLGSGGSGSQPVGFGVSRRMRKPAPGFTGKSSYRVSPSPPRGRR